MKKAFLIVLVIAGLFLVTPSSHAQEGMKRGAIELGVLSDSIDGGLSPFAGYFITDELEAMLHFNFTHAEVDLPGTTGDSEEDAVLIGATLIYNLPTGTRFVPLAGAGISYLRDEIDGDKTDLIAMDLSVGVRYFVSEHGAISLLGEFGFGDADFTSGSDSVSGDITTFDVGLAYSIFF